VDGPAKVGELEFAVDAEQEVLGLDVAVDDVLAVQVRERVGHLRDILCSGRRLRTSRTSEPRTTADLRSLKRPFLLSCL
jgi:hypothetical protein